MQHLNKMFYFFLGKLKWDDFQEKIVDLCNLTVASATVSVQYEAVYGSKMIPCHFTMKSFSIFSDYIRNQ